MFVIFHGKKIIVTRIFQVPKHTINKLCIFLNMARLVYWLAVLYWMAHKVTGKVKNVLSHIPVKIHHFCLQVYLVFIPSYTTPLFFLLQGMLSHWGAIISRQVICLPPTTYWKTFVNHNCSVIFFLVSLFSFSF